MKHIKKYEWKKDASNRSIKYLELMDQVYAKMRETIENDMNNNKDWPYASELYDTTASLIENLSRWDDKSYNDFITKLENINKV